ncbi:unnamed protein product, partial [marine sediment metagenome]
CVKKRRKSEEQHKPPGDPFDLWLAMVGTLVIEPMIDVFRSAGRLARGTRRQSRRRSRGDGRRRDKP